LKRLRGCPCPLGDDGGAGSLARAVDLELTALNQIEEQTLMVERKLNALGNRTPRFGCFGRFPGWVRVCRRRWWR